MGAVLLNGSQHWECPNCPATHVTALGEPHIPFHQCPGLRGILAPYVEAGTRCTVQARDREDYVGAERGLHADGGGRPVMSVVTERWDGSTDCAVFPGCATATQQEEG